MKDKNSLWRKISLYFVVFMLFSAYICIAGCGKKVAMAEEARVGTSEVMGDTISVEEALKLVRAYTGHQDSYIPLRQHVTDENLTTRVDVIGDVYSFEVLGSQVSIIYLYHDTYGDGELDTKYFFFHLNNYLIDNLETGDWHSASLNFYAVDKNTGEIFAKLDQNGRPNRALGSPFWE